MTTCVFFVLCRNFLTGDNYNLPLPHCCRHDNKIFHYSNSSRIYSDGVTQSFPNMTCHLTKVSAANRNVRSLVALDVSFLLLLFLCKRQRDEKRKSRTKFQYKQRAVCPLSCLCAIVCCFCRYFKQFYLGSYWCECLSSQILTLYANIHKIC